MSESRGARPAVRPGSEVDAKIDTDVRSEGMSYGMMITVQLDKKAEFDALWNCHSPGLVATNGAASLAATDRARARRFVDALWNLSHHGSQWEEETKRLLPRARRR